MGNYQNYYINSVDLCQSIYDKTPSNRLPKHSIETFSGLRARIFEIDDVTYVTFCGTNSLRDWITNFKALFCIPRQFKQSLKFVKDKLEYDETKKIVVTGHSLAGGISQFISVNLPHDNVVCFTFNPMGTRHLLKPKKYKLYENNIWNIVTHRDLLYRLTAILPFNWMKNVGKTIIIQDDESWNGIKSHSNWKIFSEFKFKD